MGVGCCWCVDNLVCQTSDDSHALRGMLEGEVCDSVQMGVNGRKKHSFKFSRMRWVFVERVIAALESGREFVWVGRGIKTQTMHL